MDPEKTLAILRETAARIINAADEDACDTERFRSDAVQLAEAFEALDNWRINGGFLPEVWRKP